MKKAVKFQVKFCCSSFLRKRSSKVPRIFHDEFHAVFHQALCSCKCPISWRFSLCRRLSLKLFPNKWQPDCSSSLCPPKIPVLWFFCGGGGVRLSCFFPLSFIIENKFMFLGSWAIWVRYFRNPCDRDRPTRNFKNFKFFKSTLKILNVYFWGTSVYFWGTSVGDNRGFRDFCVYLLGERAFTFGDHRAFTLGDNRGFRDYWNFLFCCRGVLGLGGSGVP